MHTLTSTLPTTPASSMVSLKAACSMDSSVSQPPWGQTTHAHNISNKTKRGWKWKKKKKGFKTTQDVEEETIPLGTAFHDPSEH